MGVMMGFLLGSRFLVVERVCSLILQEGHRRAWSRWCSVPQGAASMNHRIIGWKRPLRSSSPIINPTPPFLLKHIPKCHIYTFFEHLQGWGLHHIPGQPVPMPEHSFTKEMFPNI